ncbi:unnamed protein product [Aphanomyces euteiches]
MVRVLGIDTSWLLGGFLSYLFGDTAIKNHAHSSGEHRAPLMKNWRAFESPLVQPATIDMRTGGHLEMYVGETLHAWGGGAPSGVVFGFAERGSKATFPGPTILTARGVPVSVKWSNRIGPQPHLLHRNTEPSLMIDASSCYPKCGVPMAIHVHGLEVPAKYDGLPTHTFYHNTTYYAYYTNRQNPSTKIYHDHALGLAPLNTWAGMIGTYIVQDPELEERFNLVGVPDMLLIIQDKLIAADGSLRYTEDLPCNPVQSTHWVPESYGSVNTVNGIVMPLLTVEARTVRFRWVNAANARIYTFNLPFASHCTVIASDGGFVQKPQPVPGRKWRLYPLDRVEMLCDFTGLEPGTAFDVLDRPFQESSYEYDERVLRVQIIPATSTQKVELPSQLAHYKDFKTLHRVTQGLTRSITMADHLDSSGCSTRMDLIEFGDIKDIGAIHHTLHCTRGKVEKWLFHNPTEDPHPFHWHLVNAQCGIDDDSINTNELKDVLTVPPRTDDEVAYVCYVACTPDEFLNTGSTRTATDFGFDVTEDPYLAHCHIMEHGENLMMAWFHLTSEDVEK